MEEFDSNRYGADVARVLGLDGGGRRAMALTCGRCAPQQAQRELKGMRAGTLFSGAREPEAAMAGLWLYFSCFEESHSLAQDLSTKEGELWHAILHRQEPDSGNAAYWFRQVGAHATFPKIARRAGEILESMPEAEFRVGTKWDPFAFVAFCERARTQPGSAQERAAQEIQLAEWQTLFDYCAASESLGTR
jgi:hypothetical protein